MSSTERRERERAQRHQLIITAARELAEAEGWDAVTTRRLAERVEYSQPVLYSHFKGKDAIVRAVALEGFDDLGAQMRRARLAEISPKEALRALGRAYLDFAADRPALYEAMFIMPTDLAFAGTETPPALRAAFGEIVAVVGPRDGVGLYAEVFWGSLHGIAVLVHGKRMPAEHQGDRLDLLVEHFTPEAG
ncbi:transcriptional regulator, TetR family protein [Streptomyces bingchenggensis BCW-1]|uniref:Transcriptional regulator, TetR family protein n=1 Tax=Streptomyces bingchenggensis (strain BCW-1) TaxID=749414 RepID=D7CAP5_STRBB|nr:MULTISPECIES: TetR/AcrR family transcriptional regulator [Streptomyces]ADI08612.1 transcriptional regulator, TetR family protein [Streptomyces bingchenggensis BCW-1]